MKTNTWNPFPGVTDVVPFWINHGTCYSRAAYTDLEVAQKVAAHVRARGGTVNGGYLDGMPLGNLYHIPARAPVPVNSLLPESLRNPADEGKMTDGVPENWEVTF